MGARRCFEALEIDLLDQLEEDNPEGAKECLWRAYKRLQWEIERERRPAEFD